MFVVCADIYADYETPSAPHGLWLGRLLFDDATWVHRRVESVAFEGVDVVARRVSVDFTLPEFPDLGPFSHVPLALLKKEVLSTFSLLDEDGSSLPLLTQEQNGWFAWSLLHAVSEGVAGEALPDGVSADLRVIAQADPETATRRLRSFRTFSAGPPRWQLAGDADWLAMATDLARNFVLLADLSEAPDRRRILKYSYVEPLMWAHQWVRRDWRAALGSRHREFGFVTPGVGEGASYHFELRAPEGVEITFGRLDAVSETESWTDERLAEGDRIHLHLSGVPRQTFSASDATIWMRPARHGFLRAGVLTALAVTTILAAATAVASRLPSGEGADSATGLLLVLPAAVATYLVVPGEHSLVSRLLLIPRLLLTGSASVAYFAAVLLPVGLTGEPLRWSLAALGLVAAAITWALEQAHKR